MRSVLAAQVDAYTFVQPKRSRPPSSILKERKASQAHERHHSGLQTLVQPCLNLDSLARKAPNRLETRGTA